MAYSEVQATTSLTQSDSSTNPAFSGSGTGDDFAYLVTGWTAGGGVEYAFAGNWSAKLEYLHVDFGSQHFSRIPVGAGSFDARDVTLTNDIVRAGVNYKFGWDGPVVARY